MKDSLGKRIIDLRKKKGMSQEELASKMLVSRQTVYKWESDVVMPSADNVKALCEMFDVSADWLLANDKNTGATDCEKTCDKAFPKKYIAFLCVAVVTLLLSVVSTVFVGFLSHTSNRGDVVAVSTSVDIWVFYLLLFSSVVAAVIVLFCAVKIGAKSKCKQISDNL